VNSLNLVQLKPLDFSYGVTIIFKVSSTSNFFYSSDLKNIQKKILIPQLCFLFKSLHNYQNGVFLPDDHVALQNDASSTIQCRKIFKNKKNSTEVSPLSESNKIL
jgi:hypothetical protein